MAWQEPSISSASNRRSSMIDEPLAKVALAISAFRSDQAVSQMLETAFAQGPPGFGAVIVVDSLGSGAIARLVERNGWPVHYINSDGNLGSAGNLDLRLRTAADLGLEWCLALNHDGELDLGKVRRLVEHGRANRRAGVIYPQLVFSSAGGRRDSPRRTFSTYGMLDRGDDEREADSCVEVAWGSSNGALYRLDAIRSGVSAWPELWMGYEDLAIGWELKRQGWLQLLCTDVEVTDNYEYAPVRLLGREVYLATKPSWYTYYHVRNQLLIARGTGGTAVGWASIFARAIVDVALILLFRDRKGERLRLLVRGAVDGLKGRSGKGPVP